MIAPVALALLRLLRDGAENVAGWGSVLDFIGRLPAELAQQEEVREQKALALSNAGQHLEAIAEIEALVAGAGPTPERLGLLGGRYKRLLSKASTPVDRLTYLSRSIESYEQGMELDLNDYYCSSNLPRLYRQRKRKGDEERAQSVLSIVIAACERARRRNVADEWLRPTLLGAAFDAGDADKAEELAPQVAAEGPARWKLDAIASDLEGSIAQVKDEDGRARLASVLAVLKS